MFRNKTQNWWHGPRGRARCKINKAVKREETPEIAEAYQAEALLH